MNRRGAAPLWEQIARCVAGPPIMAFLIRLMSRGWARTVQGGTISEPTEKRQRIEFWAVPIFMYPLVLVEIIYAHLTN